MRIMNDNVEEDHNEDDVEEGENIVGDDAEKDDVG